MSKIEHATSKATAKADSNAFVVGGIRIAKVSYDYHQVRINQNGVAHSIGAIIDKHIADTIERGEMVSEVSLFFETREQQEEIAKFYSPVTNI